MNTAQYPAASMVIAQHSVASRTGAEGGVITVHRTMATVPLTASDVVTAFALSAAFTALAFVLAPGLFSLWKWTFVHLGAALGLQGSLRYVPAALVGDSIPMLAVSAAQPSSAALVTGALVVLALLVAARMTGDRVLPLTYVLRAIALVLATAVVVHALDDRPPSFDLPAYTRTLLKVSAGIWLFVPIGYGLTLFLLDITWTRKAALMALALTHLALFVPLQTLLTQYVVQHLSLLVLPLVFVFAGILPQIAVVIALYSWGASWPARTR